MIRRLCSHGGCSEYQPCPRHGRENRPNAAARGYCSARWKRLRKIILARDPICRWPDCAADATEVDHITPKDRGGDDSEENLQGLCKCHHAVKTRQGL